MYMILTKDEFARLVDVRDTMKEAVGRIDIFKPFMEDPTELINDLAEALEHLDKEIKMLVKVSDALKKEGLIYIKRGAAVAREAELRLNKWKETFIAFVLFAFCVGVGAGYFWAMMAFAGH